VEASSPTELGSSEPKASKRRINLERASILLIDNAWGLELLSRIFMGFGARRLFRAPKIADANELLDKQQFDLVVAEAVINGEDIYEFMRNLRLGSDHEPNRFVPVIILSAHTESRKITMARDCGVNFFVAKPISPKVMMDRVLWVANTERKYLETNTYAGPDRRFRDEPLAPGLTGRRRGDPKPDLELQEKSA